MDISPGLREHYEDYYDGASEWRRLGAVGKADNIVRVCAGRPVESVLDIGCGDGAVIARLEETGFGKTFSAVDISSSGIATLKARGLKRLVSAEVFDGSRLPQAGQGVDLAILSHVVEHLEHPRQLLNEAARVARWVVVEVPLEDTWRHPRDYRPSPVGHINFYSRANLRRLVQTCGLEVVCERISNPPLAVYRHMNRTTGPLAWAVKQSLLAVLGPLATRLTCYHYTVLCRRPGPPA
ncbi:MAG: class I SAM-dependent methyltransferase [Kiritimatiellia bacterium]